MWKRTLQTTVFKDPHINNNNNNNTNHYKVWASPQTKRRQKIISSSPPPPLPSLHAFFLTRGLAACEINFAPRKRRKCSKARREDTPCSSSSASQRDPSSYSQSREGNKGKFGKGKNLSPPFSSSSPRTFIRNSC